MKRILGTSSCVIEIVGSEGGVQWIEFDLEIRLNVSIKSILIFDLGFLMISWRVKDKRDGLFKIQGGDPMIDQMVVQADLQQYMFQIYYYRFCQEFRMILL